MLYGTDQLRYRKVYEKSGFQPIDERNSKKVPKHTKSGSPASAPSHENYPKVDPETYDVESSGFI